MRNLLTVLLAIITAAPAFADGSKHTPDEEVNTASDASFDKRLPPVLPGEEVNDSGHRMKAWSTSGSVVEKQRGQVTPNVRLDDVDVLVDERDRRDDSTQSEEGSRRR